MNLSKNIIIFKNDAVGDLVQSISSINNIIKHNPKNKIIIYLSERSKDFSFFVSNENVEIRIVNYDLSIIQNMMNVAPPSDHWISKNEQFLFQNRY